MGNHGIESAEITVDITNMIDVCRCYYYFNNSIVNNRIARITIHNLVI